MTHNLKEKKNYHTLVIHSTDNSFGFGYRKNNNIDSDKFFIKQFDNDLCNNLIVEFNKFIAKENQSTAYDTACWVLAFIKDSA